MVEHSTIDSDSNINGSTTIMLHLFHNYDRKVNNILANFDSKHSHSRHRAHIQPTATMFVRRATLVAAQAARPVVSRHGEWGVDGAV